MNASDPIRETPPPAPQPVEPPRPEAPPGPGPELPGLPPLSPQPPAPELPGAPPGGPELPVITPPGPEMPQPIARAYRLTCTFSASSATKAAKVRPEVTARATSTPARSSSSPKAKGANAWRKRDGAVSNPCRAP